MQRLKPGREAQASSAHKYRCRPCCALPSATLPGNRHERRMAAGRCAASHCGTHHRTHGRLVLPTTACRQPRSSPRAVQHSGGAEGRCAQHAAGLAAALAVLISSACPPVLPAGAAETSTQSIRGTSSKQQPAALLAAPAHAAPQLTGMPACQGTAAGDSVPAARTAQSSARQPRGRLREVDLLHSGTAQVSRCWPYKALREHSCCKPQDDSATSRKLCGQDTVLSRTLVLLACCLAVM